MCETRDAVPDKVRLQYDTLLRELHNIDHVAEIHTATVVALSGALVAFVALNPENPVGRALVAIVGLILCGEWLLKLWRHGQIFRDVALRLRRIQAEQRLWDGLRPEPKVGQPDGFKILQGMAWLVALVWVSVLICSAISIFSGPRGGASLAGF